MRKAIISAVAALVIFLFIISCTVQSPSQPVASVAEMPTEEIQSEFTSAVEPQQIDESLPTVEPVTRVVTSTEEDGPGSLDDLVQGANPGDIILFSVDVFPIDDPGVIHLETHSIGFPIGGVTVDASNAGVIIDGEGGPDAGFIIESSGNRIMGIKFINFSFAAVVIKGPGMDTSLKAAVDNVIGGDRSLGDGPYGQGNCFGANRVGIAIENRALRNQVIGNLVGIEADGSPVNNSKGGVLVRGASDDNLIGPNNVIANNNEYGVKVEGSEHAIITRNAIYNQQWPLVLTYGSNREASSMIEDGSVDIDCSRGFIEAEIYPSPLMSIEVFSGDASGPMVYEGSLELNTEPNNTGDDVRITFIFDKGEAFQGDYLYFSGLTHFRDTTTFTDAVACGGR